MKNKLEVIECPPQHSGPGHPIEALRRENARAWELVWSICKLAIVLALITGIAMGVLLKTLY